MITDEKAISLSQLHTCIKTALQNQLESSYWIIAEISQMNTNYSGHCYMELIEKNENSDTIIAKNRATIWASTYRMLKAYFETSTQQKLQSGLKILIKVTVEFHSVYGLSINIKDIDPNYTLGEQQRRKLEIIRQLEDDGIIDMNKELELPEVIHKIAVISSDSAAGYGDFIDQLSNNQFSYSFQIYLYQASMQGDTAADSIMGQLDAIYESKIDYDVVAIIRGGGAATDLMCFDHYQLASHIAQFPIPVLTGIGHERDESIADIVAHTKLKTPTAVAEFIIQQKANFEIKLDSYSNQLKDKVNAFLQFENKRITGIETHLPSAIHSALNQKAFQLDTLLSRFQHNIKSHIQTETAELRHKTVLFESRIDRGIDHKKKQLKTAENTISNTVKHIIKDNRSKLGQFDSNIRRSIEKLVSNEQHRLEILEAKLKQNDPSEMLKKGYSISYVDGKILKSASQAKAGMKITTKLIDGKIDSQIL